MAVPEDNESGRMGRLSLAVVCLASALVLLAWGVARAAPPVESYWSCKGHAHIKTPSKAHAKKHRCSQVSVDPVAPAPDPPGPKPSTPEATYWRVQAQAAQAKVQALGKDLAAADARTEQARLAGEEAVNQERGRLMVEILDLRGWADQLERLTRYLLPFLADTPAGQFAGRVALSVLNSH